MSTRRNGASREKCWFPVPSNNRLSVRRIPEPRTDFPLDRRFPIRKKDPFGCKVYPVTSSYFKVGGVGFNAVETSFQFETSGGTLVRFRNKTVVTSGQRERRFKSTTYFETKEGKRTLWLEFLCEIICTRCDWKLSLIQRNPWLDTINYVPLGFFVTILP